MEMWEVEEEDEEKCELLPDLVKKEAEDEEETDFDSCWIVVVDDEAQPEIPEPSSSLSTTIRSNRNVLDAGKTQFDNAEEEAEIITSTNGVIKVNGRESRVSSEIDGLSSDVTESSVWEATENMEKSPEIFKCFKCDKVFQSLKRLGNHVRRCDKYEEDIKNHEFEENEGEYVSNRKKQKRRIKQEKSRTREALPNTIVLLKSEPNVETTNRNDMLMKIHSGSKMTDVAQMCGFRKTYACKKCSYSTVYNHNFREHMEYHKQQTILEKRRPKPKPSFTIFYKCDTCGEMYKDVDKLNDHLELHTLRDATEGPLQSNENEADESNAPFECIICSNVYFGINEYNQHLLSHYVDKNLKLEVDPESTSSVCHACGQIFYSYLLNGEKPPDSSCAKCFCKRLKNSHERRYCCEICGKLFISNKKLNQHKTVHNATFYKCKLCPLVLKHQIGLKNHMLRHKGVVRHICEVCGRGYKDPNDMKRHAFKHSITLPAKCKDCGQIFTDYRKAGDHLKVHDFSSLISVDKSQMSSFQCKECNGQFQIYTWFLKHMATVHGITNPESKDSDP